MELQFGRLRSVPFYFHQRLLEVTVKIVSVQCEVIRVLDCFQLPDVTAGVVIIS
jgi:hypothetical protein